LDLDALIGGFEPLFRALDPEKVNTIASTIITVFQGQGGTINDILDHTAQLTARLGERDQAIGEVVKNLNIVLDTAVRHREAFDQSIDNLEVLITGLKDHREQVAGGTAHISDAAGTVADLLAEDRGLLHKTVNYLDAVQQPLIDQRQALDDYLHKLPTALNLIGRSIGAYGDFVNFYACDISIKINGLQPGGPVRTVRLFQQPTGRCTPQ
ncbi:MAG: MCE family protein, partial [Mycobacterium sp.]|nr:MCE family protein [Mycobacterium sp.]